MDLGKERKNPAPKYVVALGEIRKREKSWCELQEMPMAALSIKLTKGVVSKGDQERES